MRIISVVTASLVAVGMAVLSGPLAAQEAKPVPKDSFRVTVPGCTKGYVFTAGPRLSDDVGRLDIPEGMHLRMNGPKKMMGDIKAHEGSMIQITGLMKKEQANAAGLGIGGGVRVGPGGPPVSGGSPLNINSPNSIDVESWQQMTGDCPSR